MRIVMTRRNASDENGASETEGAMQSDPLDEQSPNNTKFCIQNKRKRKRAGAESDDSQEFEIDDDDEDDDDDEMDNSSDDDFLEPPKPVRNNFVVGSSNDEDDEEEFIPTRKQARSRGRGRPRKVKDMSDDASLSPSGRNRSHRKTRLRKSFEDDLTKEDITPSEDEVLDEKVELMNEVAELVEDSYMSTRNRRKNRTPPTERRNLREKNRINYYVPLPPTLPNENFSPNTKRIRDTAAGNFMPVPQNYDGLGGARFAGIPGLTPALGGVDDSSDDMRPANARNAAGSSNNAMRGLPSSTFAPTNTQTSLGKVKSKTELADADPLGVAQDIDFSAVGGLDQYVNQLKEMVNLPLLYPEIFQQFKVTPPRGVLFHGPPGTGKTLMARALAASCSTDGRKISFYMRKGADCLSKWVGEAERQLRLLFEEARNSQPSIIFFDEIDGLAPVRSSKQEQIHASIVSTLLALMDGMDGRGQVIVIGATNRPDSVDPALRRPGRFDREFYFPLPDEKARKSIIDIHTRGWDPQLSEDFKKQLAFKTKGYGGADLRALCTEAALNSVQRVYPQIYLSSEKLEIDPKQIKVTARDFIKSFNKMVPSSERVASSNAALLPEELDPLLKESLTEILETVDKLLPQKKQLTSLEEAMLEDDDDENAAACSDDGFDHVNMLDIFEKSRIFRPRLLVYGEPDMGQSYIGPAILHHLEKFNVQFFDLASLLGDSTKSLETCLIHTFAEVKRRKPSVIYIPGIDVWARTISNAALDTFSSLLNGIPASDPILVLALSESGDEELDPRICNLFGYSCMNRVRLSPPSGEMRKAYFKSLVKYIRMAPTDFPQQKERKKKKLKELPKAPPAPKKQWTKEELQELEDKDRQLINHLKIRLSPFMELLRTRYRKFRKPLLDEDMVISLPPYDPSNEPEAVPAGTYTLFPYCRTADGRIKDRRLNVSFHNMGLDRIEERLWGGYYLTPQQFAYDLGLVAEDSKLTGDRDRAIKVCVYSINFIFYFLFLFFFFFFFFFLFANLLGW